MTTHITLIATLRAQDGKQAALEARMADMVTASRTEAGCLRYDLQRSNEDACELVVVEYWRDEEAIALHDASEHMAALKRDLPALLARPVAVRRFTPL